MTPTVGPVRLAVVICTYNRAASLLSTLESLYATYDENERVDIRVVVNACNDRTLAALAEFRASHISATLDLAWIVEPAAGKSRALNTALREWNHEALCFVDDDQIAATGFLSAILDGLTAYPEDDILCGYLWPAWNGSEPPWVHVREPWAIPIRPFPEFDLGPNTFRLPPHHRLPSGGNITVRRRVFERIGGFSTDIGPRGHDLGGGEDHDFLTRARAAGFHFRYLPEARQLHAVDPARMTTAYILKKSYVRSRSNLLIHGGGKPRPFMIRKILGHALRTAFSFRSNRRFFYGVRLAASVGELHGALIAAASPRRHSRRRCIVIGDSVTRQLQALGVLTLVLGLLAILNVPLRVAYAPTLWAATLATLVLAGRSLLYFSRTGPRVRREVLTRYRMYSLYAFARLSIYAMGISLLLGIAGEAVYAQLCVLLAWNWSTRAAFAASLAGIVVGAGWRLVVKLLFNPGLIIASTNYLPSRLYPLWRLLSPARIQLLRATSVAALLALASLTTQRLLVDGAIGAVVALWTGILFFVCAICWSETHPEGHATPISVGRTDRPNILMLGSDTLRADALGRGITPNLDRLAQTGAWFSECYVPCARTAPSLVSLFTGQWPANHGVRDNFVTDSDANRPFSALPGWLRSVGYRCATISDWCGADFGKFDLGFDLLDLPEDQWNLKYLIRQGPKDLRLFLSLFLHNRAGRLLLPEIYYQGGVALTSHLGSHARRLLSRLGEDGTPFFLNVFYSTTHPPFASEWPWYMRHTDPAYEGESKFAMARLTDPMDVLRRQGEPREEFDLDQVLHLYDGAVAQFDHQVGLMLNHLAACGLAQNTIVVVYSDHGMEFFEHDTWGQGNSAVGEASPRIPLLLRDPRRAGRGRVNKVVRSIDLAPTLADLAGVSPLGRRDGISLKPLLDDPHLLVDLVAYSETGMWLTAMPGQTPDHLHYPDILEVIDVPDPATGTLAIKAEYRRKILAAKDRMVRQGPWKLVYQPVDAGCRLLLFNLEADPACKHDVAAEHPPVVSTLWRCLQTWLEADELGAPCTQPTAPSAANFPT